MWNNIPYIDETIDYAKGNYDVPNTTDAWPKIEADFQFGYDSLPGTAIAKGRAQQMGFGSVPRQMLHVPRINCRPHFLC